jgi:hypothetical protein
LLLPEAFVDWKFPPVHTPPELPYPPSFVTVAPDDQISSFRVRPGFRRSKRELDRHPERPLWLPGFMMQITLALHDSSQKVHEFQLERFPIVIGRSDSADIQLSDRWVSRRHCEIDADHGQLIVRDLDSRHGTLVNSRPVAECVLLPGDRLNVGLSEFVASYATQQPESADLQAAR